MLLMVELMQCYRVKHDNHGKLEQEIRDAFNLVNQNGALSEMQELAGLPFGFPTLLGGYNSRTQTQREEQREIKEQMREEEKARREYEKAKKEAEKREANQSGDCKSSSRSCYSKCRRSCIYEAQMEQLRAQLSEAEAKNQRSLSMAQQTRMGHIYVISNEGSFGEGILKIGMTRRLDRWIELKN